jgi:pimeloyl-ACP methyl ester carboxylesterase
VPTLVVHGAGDLLIPPARGKEAAELIPGATFQLIDGMLPVLENCLLKSF